VRIVALIPAFNEEDRIAATVKATRAIAGVDEVIVIADGSHDDTAQRATQADARCIRIRRRGFFATNVGKGGALEYVAPRTEDADIVLLLDADLGHSAAQAASLLTPLLDGRAAMSIASFPRPAGKAGFGLVKGLAARAIARSDLAMKRKKGLDATQGWLPDSPLSGQRALTQACLQAIRPFASGYGVEVAETIRALRAGFAVIEVPTTMTHAATGRNLAGFLHRGKQLFHVLRTLLFLKFEAR
jgi:glycosyltransferase involved in cell wall biosynthesis